MHKCEVNLSLVWLKAIPKCLIGQFPQLLTILMPLSSNLLKPWMQQIVTDG